jgi:outer membrane protein
MRIPARLLISAALAAFFSLFAGTASAQMKVAIVDVQRAVAQTEEGLRATATLKKEFDSRQQELSKRQTELQKQKDEIDKQSHVLSQQALQKKYDDWQRQMMEFQNTYVAAQKELEKQQKSLTDPIFEKVMVAIKRIAGTDGFDLIVDRSAVAFSRTDLDVTDRVIQIANNPSGGPSGPAAGPGPASGGGPAKAPAAAGGPSKP